MSSTPPPLLRIQGRVQHYQWGADAPCVVSALIPDERPPYAEVWFGSHPRLPSFLYNTDVPLQTPLPHLLKFLSVRSPLSLQVHPDTETARRLHASDPRVYPDPNEKPEICIPLSTFDCFLGFADTHALDRQLAANPPLAAFFF